MMNAQPCRSARRTSYIKRSFAALMCCVLILYMMPPKKAKALVPALVLVPGAASLIMDICVSAGITFVAIESVDTVVDAVWNNLDESTRNTLCDSYNSGTLVLDAVTGAKKKICTVSDDVWNTVRAYIDEVYNPGTNSVTQDNQGSVDLEIGETIDIFDGLPFVFYFDAGKGMYEYILSGSTVTENRWYNGNVMSTSNSFNCTYFYIARLANGQFTMNTNGSPAISMSIAYSAISNSSYGSIVEIGSVTGSESVDDPDRTFDHESTGEKTFAVGLDIGSDGEVLTDGDDIPVADYEKDKDLVIGKTAADLAEADVSGIPLVASQELTIPAENVGVTDLPITPEAGSESQTSLKALLFSKFPFCLPWDIKNAFSLLLATPAPPEWEIDLVPQTIKSRCGITAETKWEINMDDFEIVGQVSRWTSTIGFCIALIVLTRKIIHS